MVATLQAPPSTIGLHVYGSTTVGRKTQRRTLGRDKGTNAEPSFNAPLLLSLLTTQRKPQRTADFAHPYRTQPGHSPSQPLLGDHNRILQIHRARRLHPVLFIQHHLRRDSSNRGRDWGHHNGRQYPTALSRVSTTTGLFLPGGAKW